MDTKVFIPGKRYNTMELLNSKTVGAGMIVAGGALAAASFMPSAIGPGITQGSAMLVGGLGVAGLGAATYVMGRF